MEHSGDPASVEAVFATLSALRWGKQLSSISTSYSDPNLIAFLGGAGSLEHLERSVNAMADEDWVVPSSFPFSLASLVTSEDATLPLLNALTSNSWTTLRSLPLSSPLLADLTLLTRFDALQSLTLILAAGTLHDYVRPNDEYLDQAAVGWLVLSAAGSPPRGGRSSSLASPPPSPPSTSAIIE